MNAQQKQVLKSRFSGVTDDDLDGSDDEVIRRISERTGQNPDQIRHQVNQVRQQSQGQPGQGQQTQ